MRIVSCKNYEDMSQKIALDFLGEISKNPELVLGLATGSTPEGVYQQLVKAYQEGKVDFSKVISINLDEYKGLSPENPQSYRYFMNHHLFDHINIKKENTYVPNGLEEDSEKACAEYEEIISKLGEVDVQLLGIGGNGHIGFNEPSDAFVVKTHCVDLTKSTIEANARFFHCIDDVPKQAYSMGIGNIMAAKKIILAVSGRNKAKALYETVCGEVRPSVQASILQFHKNVTVYADEDALSLLCEKGML